MILKLTFSAILSAGLLLAADSNNTKACEKDFTTVDYIKFDGQCIEINKEMQKAIGEIINKHKNDANTLYETYKKPETAKKPTPSTSPSAESKTASDTSKAEALFKKCIACHGVKAEKQALGKSGIIAGMSKEVLITSMKGYKEGTLNKNGMGSLMKAQMASLGEEDIKLLAELISEINK